MESDWWLELESSYIERIEQRRKLYEKHGKLIIDSLPGSSAACTELMEMVIQFLCVRYPKSFEFDSETGCFHNHILGTNSDTRCTPPLYFLLCHVPEDFLIVLENTESGLYHMVAGVSCSAVGWNMAAKIGKPLHEIHDPVPEYKEKLQFSMDR